MSKLTQSFYASLKNMEERLIEEVNLGRLNNNLETSSNSLWHVQANYAWISDIWDSYLQVETVKMIKEQTDKTTCKIETSRQHLTDNGEQIFNKKVNQRHKKKPLNLPRKQKFKLVSSKILSLEKN